MVNIAAIKALATEKELDELRVVGIDIGPKTGLSSDSSPIRKERVTLRRTFNMTMEGMTLRFWRVTGPATHPNYHSDLSLMGLRQWGIIK